MPSSSSCRVSKHGKLQQIQQSLNSLPLHFVAVVAAVNTLATPALADIQVAIGALLHFHFCVLPFWVQRDKKGNQPLSFGTYIDNLLVQTVPSSQATEYAKPIPRQKTDKGFVALLFAAGAASLFGSALLLEKNSKLFPAINKTNQVMREAEKRNKVRAAMFLLKTSMAHPLLLMCK